MKEVLLVLETPERINTKELERISTDFQILLEETRKISDFRESLIGDIIQ